MEFLSLAPLLLLCTFQISSTSPFHKDFSHMRSSVFAPPEQNKWAWDDAKGQYSLPIYFEELPNNSDQEVPAYTLQNEQPLYDHTNIHQNYYYTSRINIRVPNHNLNKRAGEGDLGLSDYKNPQEEDNQIRSLHGYRESNLKENEAPVHSGPPLSADDACQSCQQKAYNPAHGHDKNMLIWCALLECQRRERLMRLKELIDSQRQVLKGKLNDLIKDDSKIKVTDAMNNFPSSYDYDEYYGEEDDPYPNYYLYEDIQSNSENEAGYSNVPNSESTNIPNSPTAVLYTKEYDDNPSYINTSPSDIMKTTLKENYKYYDGSKENYSTKKSKLLPKGEDALYNHDHSQSDLLTNSSSEDYNFYDDPQYVNLTEEAQLSPKSEGRSSSKSSKAIIVSPNAAEEDTDFYDDLEFTNINVEEKNSSSLNDKSSMDPKGKFHSSSTKKKFASNYRGKMLPELYKRVTKYPLTPHVSRIYPSRMTTSTWEDATDSYLDGSLSQHSEIPIDDKQLELGLQRTKFPVLYSTKGKTDNEGKTSYMNNYVTLDEDLFLRPSTVLPLPSHDLKAHEPISNFKNADDREGFNITADSTRNWFYNAIKHSTTPLPPTLGATMNYDLERVKYDVSRKTSEQSKSTTEVNKKRPASNDQYLSKDYFTRHPATSSDENFNQYKHNSFNYSEKTSSNEVLATYDREKIPKDEHVFDDSYLGAVNKKFSVIPNKNEEGPFPSAILEENESEPNLPGGNDLTYSLEKSAKKDKLPATIHFYDKMEKDGKVVKYCLCQCPTEVSPTNISFSESENDNEYKGLIELESHSSSGTSFTSNKPSTTSPLDIPEQLFPYKEKFDSHKQSNTSTSSNEYSFSTFDPNSNHSLVADDGKELFSNNDRNEKGIMGEDVDPIDNIRETKSPLFSKSDKIPHSTSRAISTTSETDNLNNMDREDGYDHLIPVNFKEFAEYMDNPYSSRVNSKTDHDDTNNGDAMPGLISKPDGIVELEYDCRDQMFPHNHLSIDSAWNLKELDPEKEYQLLNNEQKSSLMSKSGNLPINNNKGLPNLFHSLRGNTEMKSEISTSSGERNVSSGKAAEHEKGKKHILEDLLMEKEQKRKLPAGGNINPSTSNSDKNKAPLGKDSILSLSKLMSGGEDQRSLEEKIRDQSKLNSYLDFKEADPDSSENDYKFPHVYHNDQFQQISTLENVLLDKSRVTDKILPLPFEPISPASFDISQSSEKANVASECPSIKWTNRELSMSKLNPMINSLQKIKKNYMREGDESAPSTSQDKSKSCDEACKQHIKDKLKALISVISWLEESMR